jgi:hypothetical protein
MHRLMLESRFSFSRASFHFKRALQSETPRDFVKKGKSMKDRRYRSERKHGRPCQMSGNQISRCLLSGEGKKGKGLKNA